MKLHEKINQIKQLEAVQTPWAVKRIFGTIELFGSQLSIQNDGTSDFVTLEEFQQALQWMAEQCGGTVKWTKKEPKV